MFGFEGPHDIETTEAPEENKGDEMKKGKEKKEISHAKQLEGKCMKIQAEFARRMKDSKTTKDEAYKIAEDADKAIGKIIQDNPEIVSKIPNSHHIPCIDIPEYLVFADIDPKTGKSIEIKFSLSAYKRNNILAYSVSPPSLPPRDEW